LKNFFYILILCSVAFNCSKDSENNIEENSNCIVGEIDTDITSNRIIGEWKLLKSKTYFHDYDYSNQNIIYNFKSNGELVVTGANKTGGYPIGTYNYTFEEDYLSNSANPNEPMLWLVNIDGLKWIHQSQNDLMVIGQSYVDGSDLCFQKK